MFQHTQYSDICAGSQISQHTALVVLLVVITDTVNWYENANWCLLWTHLRQLILLLARNIHHPQTIPRWIRTANAFATHTLANRPVFGTCTRWGDDCVYNSCFAIVYYYMDCYFFHSPAIRQSIRTHTYVWTAYVHIYIHTHFVERGILVNYSNWR